MVARVKEQKTRVDIYEIDRSKKPEKGTNPIKIDTLRIPFVGKVDVRALAAKDAAEARMSRKASTVRHGEDMSVVVTFNKGVL